jgi:hypothetical protein
MLIVQPPPISIGICDAEVVAHAPVAVEAIGMTANEPMLMPMSMYSIDRVVCDLDIYTRVQLLLRDG